MLDKYFPLYIIVFLLTLSLTAIIEKRIIPLLSRNAKQPIYEGGPRWHLTKSGTPTMGGLAFLISVTLAIISTSAFILLRGNERDKKSERNAAAIKRNAVFIRKYNCTC